MNIQETSIIKQSINSRLMATTTKFNILNEVAYGEAVAGSSAPIKVPKIRGGPPKSGTNAISELL